MGVSGSRISFCGVQAMNLSFMCAKSLPNLLASMGLHDLRVLRWFTFMLSILLMLGKVKFMEIICGLVLTSLIELIAVFLLRLPYRLLF